MHITKMQDPFFGNGEVFRNPKPAPSWQKALKRLFDITAAFTGLLILFPLLIYIAVRVKKDSKGPVFYFQERIGYKGIPFIIFKFRSMYQNSEMNGPCLSFDNDERITKWGSTIRKWKLDELPQLFNILLGDMSLVGPRPERKFYIDKVAANCPSFTYLHQVKPGLTSLGMIKFGYAHDLQQIRERLTYDIAYVENYSLFLDAKIIYYTLRSLAAGTILHSSPKSMIRLPLHKTAITGSYS